MPLPAGQPLQSLPQRGFSCWGLTFAARRGTAAKRRGMRHLWVKKLGKTIQEGEEELLQSTNVENGHLFFPPQICSFCGFQTDYSLQIFTCHILACFFKIYMAWECCWHRMGVFFIVKYWFSSKLVSVKARMEKVSYRQTFSGPSFLYIKYNTDDIKYNTLTQLF